MDLVKVCVGLSVFLTLGCCGATSGSKLYAALGDTEENARDSTGSHVREVCLHLPAQAE